MPKQLTHVDEKGRARMVDVGEKPVTRREATARGELRAAPAAIRAAVAGRLPKGDLWAAARLAGIQAAKRTAEWIPLCHTLPLDSVQVDFLPRKDKVIVTSTAICHAKTGVEMEALTAVSAACLTLYDMLKAVDKNMEIGPIHVLEKKGGRSGHWRRGEGSHGR